MAKVDQLTPREYRVAMLVARGLSYKEVAHQSGLSHHTVKLYMHKIIHKLGVKSKSEAMILWANSSTQPPRTTNSD